MSVSIRAKLPKGDTNGLANHEQWLADNPDGVLTVVGILRADTVESRPHNDDDPRLVKTVLLHLEAINGTEGGRAEKAMRKAYETRTGKRELPFEEQPTPDARDDGEDGTDAGDAP